MRLEEATWADAAEAAGAANAVLLLPVGSVEQHGPHAPLGTDCLTAEAVAERAADVATAEGASAVVGPTLSVGIAEEHRAFPGTAWVSPDTFRAYLRETLESLAAHGWRRCVVVNGHGGNTDAIREVAARLTRDGTARVVPFTWFEAVSFDEQRMGHGGPVETSAVMAIRPSLVREDRLEQARDGGADRWGEWVAGVNMAVDTDEFAENGVVGDPTDATAALGEQALASAADALRSLMAALASRTATTAADGDR